MKPKILILDDEQAVTQSLKDYLTAMSYVSFTANRINEAVRILELKEIDVILLDINMPDMDGITFLQRIKPLYPTLQVIMISAMYHHDSVVRSMQEGAVDFIRKPFDMNEVLMSLKRALNLQDKEYQVQQTNSRFQKLTSLMQQQQNSLIYQSAVMAEVARMAETIAAIEDVPVLLTGESGTGKEIVARFIHEKSKRHDKIFIPANCASIPFDLFESEFFGHQRGSFTGASNDQTGLFELATDGILFMDEINEMDIRLQPKLLRVLESKELMSIGAKKITKINTRVIAATNRSIKNSIKEGTFRNDLYHRLGVFEIHLPPLRDRKEDIPLLFEFFIRQLSQRHNRNFKNYNPDIIEKMMQHPFPGNVRELRNMVERAVIVAQTDELQLGDFNPDWDEQLHSVSKKKKMISVAAENYNLDQQEYALIVKALAVCQNNKVKTAQKLGITQQSLRRRMEKFGIAE